MPVTEIKFDQLVLLVAVVLALLGAYKVVMDAVKTHREEKRLKSAPVAALKERLDAHDRMLANDKARLDRIDKQIEDLSCLSTITLRGVRAILSHEVSGNSTDKMKASMSEIDDYLIRRR